MLKNTFAGEFDGCFSTCDIGYKKSNPAYFKSVIALLQNELPGLQPANIMYLDDDNDKLEAAKTCGIDGELYESPHKLRTCLGSTAGAAVKKVKVTIYSSLFGLSIISASTLASLSAILTTSLSIFTNSLLALL